MLWGEVHNQRRLKEVRRALRTQGTPSEATLWKALRNKGLDGRKFRRQHSVGPYVLDLYCPAERLCVELDGASHENPHTSANDIHRDEFLAASLIRVLRIQNSAVVYDLQGVLDLIQAQFRK